MAWNNITIICGNGIQSAFRNNDPASHVIAVDSEDMLQSVISLIEAEGTDELERVIFGSSVPLETFMSFLTDLPADFRGDVAICTKQWGAFLSSAAVSGTGRVLYELRQEDLLFYLRAYYRSAPAQAA